MGAHDFGRNPNFNVERVIIVIIDGIKMVEIDLVHNQVRFEYIWELIFLVLALFLNFHSKLNGSNHWIKS